MAKLTQEEIENLLIDGDITMVGVINAVIKINGIIGVGLISFADDVSRHIREGMSKK
jgi:hypothetical protein